MFPIKLLALLLLFRSVVVECGRRLTDPNTLATLAAAEQRRQQLHSTWEDRRAGPGEDPRPALGTALGATVSAWQCHSAGTGSSSPELVALNNRIKLRRSEEQFRRIAATLNCSLPREHTAVEVYIGGLSHHWQANSFRHGMV